MTEAHPAPTQSTPRPRRAAASAPTPAARHTPQQGHLADRLRCRREQEPLRPDRKGLDRRRKPFEAASQRRRVGSPNRRQLRSAQPRGSSSNAAGCRASRRRYGPAPLIQSSRVTESSSARASSPLRPPTVSNGRPPRCCSSLDSRTANTKATGSASRRRAATPVPAQRPDRATEHHRPGTQAAAPRPPRTAAEHRQTDQQANGRHPRTQAEDRTQPMAPRTWQASELLSIGVQS